jgi:hypothetical protein
MVRGHFSRKNAHLALRRTPARNLICRRIRHQCHCWNWAKFAVMHPKIVMDVMLLDRQLNLIEEGIDVAVRIGPMVDSSLIIRKLGALRQIICAAPVYLE